MAIQYNQGKWFVGSDHLGNIVIHSTHGGDIATCDDLANEGQANAALICDAVNNTAGAGIDPNAVPGLLETLNTISARCNGNSSDSISDLLNVIQAIKIKADKAIKAAELKQ